MKKNIYFFLILLSVILFFEVKDASAKFLKTQEAKAEEIKGSFTLIFYGGRHINDLETAVFLDKEGDQYEFEPYAPEFD